MSCVCNSFTVEVGGGLVIGGSAVSTDTIIRGGAGCSGTALIDIANVLYDGWESVWPLDEGSSPYIERVYGDEGIGVIDPVQINGIGCLKANRFATNEYDVGAHISLPMDTMQSLSFTASFWIRPYDEFKQRVIYSRGRDSAEDQWSFAISYSVLNHIIVSVNHGDSLVTECFSNPLERDRWYHVGIVYDDLNEIRVFVNGVLSGSEALNQSAVLPLTDGYFGSLNGAGFPTCDLQEFRLWPDIKTVDELADEMASWCGDFAIVGEVVEI